MVMAYDNAERRHGAITFPLRVETIPEVREELNSVRKKGGFTTVGEIDPGMRGISVPILLAESVIGSLNVAGPRQGFSNSEIHEVLEKLAQAAAKIAQELYRATLLQS